MIIKSIRLLNFRNYIDEAIEFSDSLNVIYGENAQGKTNILESIFLCASGRSHRTSKDHELINTDSEYSRIWVGLLKNDRQTSVEMALSKRDRKKVWINSVHIRKLAELMGFITVVMFSPEDLMVIKEGPSERRRFIDITLSQLKPSYFFDLQQYNRILLQKNTVLKSGSSSKALWDTIEIWNKSLARIGARIMATRNEYVKKLSGKAGEKHLSLSDGKELLSIRYSPSFPLEGETREEIEAKFIKVLKDSAEKEMARQTTLFGPQRDEYEVILNGASIKQYGSQGQQRSAILSIKLSELDIIKEETGDYPVLLLDDVMSELDVNRQKYLLGCLEKVQVFATCTDESFFRKEKSLRGRFLKIQGGKVVEAWQQQGEDLISRNV